MATKKVHPIKFQSVVALIALIANLYGPVEGRRHDMVCLVNQAYFTIFSSIPTGWTTTFFVCMVICLTLFDHNLWIFFKLQQEHLFKTPEAKPWAN